MQVIQPSLQALASFCKNHQQEKAEFFLSEQPWIKYCKNCALNTALCGKKIQKQMSQIQFTHKMQISSILNEFNSTLQNIEENNSIFGQLINALQQCVDPFLQKIKKIEQQVNTLIELKCGLQKMYKQQITDKISTYLQKQGKLTLISKGIKSQIQNIQSKFTEYIALIDENVFKQKCTEWESLVESTLKQTLRQQQFQKINNQIQIFKQQFSNQIQTIKLFSINVSPLSFKLKTKYNTQQSVDMILTPIQNSIATSHIKCGRLKLRSNTKKTENNQKYNQRQILTYNNNTINQSKRQSLCLLQKNQQSFQYKKKA